MKNLNIASFDFQELTRDEIEASNGGFILETLLLVGVCVTVVGSITSTAYLMEKY